MLNFSIKIDPKTHQKYIETNITGKLLLTSPQLNKGTAFTPEEREVFHLLGKLPAAIETIDEQAIRAYKQYSAQHTMLQKNIFLRMLHETNEMLFFRLLRDHLKEMLPVLYTPIVGMAVQQFSSEYRRPRGLYIAYPERHKMKEILGNRTHPNIDVMVVTDGEGVLGIGDQGVGGMDISIAKLMVYCTTAGVDPFVTIPIMLDVGTNNQALLNDPMYIGWRHERISGKAYDDYIAQFIDAVQQTFPWVYLHWEDFGRRNGYHNLETYRDKICSFNDDIQGTGVVCIAALMAAITATNTDINKQKIVIYGAGSAGVGISLQLRDAMVHAGLSLEEANQRFWLVTRMGLYTDSSPNRTPEREAFSRSDEEISQWKIESPIEITLLEVIENVQPTILIGTSTHAGAFTEPVVREMAKHVDRPIIFPLSNPTERSEAKPKDLIDWTQGKALIATGSPFDPVPYLEHIIPIAQCNNALVFPGIGLGVMAVKASKLTDNMLWAAVQCISQTAPIRRDPMAALLPSIENCEHVSQEIALAVAEQAVKDGVTDLPPNADLKKLIQEKTWSPEYLPYRYKA